VLVGLCLMVLLLAIVPFRNGLDLMWGWWLDRPEYSHGVMMPMLAAFLIWQQKDRFEKLAFPGSWWGVALVAVGAMLLALGTLSAVKTIIQYAYVVTLAGVMVSLVGSRAAPLLIVPCAVLVLMVPLPEFIFKNLTAELQLVSSKIGVAVIRMFGVSVFLEGNVIDLGTYKLEVAEACSGLRYLFPLMTMGFIMAHFYKAAFWKRAIVFLSSIPVTILMNSLRIGIIGVMVDRWGQSMAEGFLHDFEGWVMFMASAAVLLLEIIVLSRVGRDRRPWREIFGLELPAVTPASAPRSYWQANTPFVVSCAAVVVLAATSLFSSERVEVVPERSSFAEFPNQLDGWSGQRKPIEAEYLDALKLDDYIMSDYRNSVGVPVNLYVAWYNSQRAGQSSHSPRTCIPGGGWGISSLDQVNIPQVSMGDVPLRVNRVLIANGANQQLVYYWFQQRGRVITNEYMVKWYMFWDSMTRRRTDGALVRLIAPVPQGQTLEQAEKELQNFVRTIAPRLDTFTPG
jgi:exosortase D (VPLPA-CTERM-specific)